MPPRVNNYSSSLHYGEWKNQILENIRPHSTFRKNDYYYYILHLPTVGFLSGRLVKPRQYSPSHTTNFEITADVQNEQQTKKKERDTTLEGSNYDGAFDFLATSASPEQRLKT